MRQLAHLAHGHEAGANAVGDRRAENEAAALYSDDQRDPLAMIGLRHGVDRELETLRVAQQGRDVIEKDAGLGKVRHVANPRLQKFHLSNLESCGAPRGHLIFHVEPFDAGVRGAAPHRSLEAIDGVCLSFSHDFDAAVREIAHPAVDAFTMRRVMGEPAEAHTLHTTADHEAPRNLHCDLAIIPARRDRP
jgi:hypothetical protein